LIDLSHLVDAYERKNTFLSFNQIVKIVTTKAQKQLESFKTEKLLNRTLLRFLAK